MVLHLPSVRPITPTSSSTIRHRRRYVVDDGAYVFVVWTPRHADDVVTVDAQPVVTVVEPPAAAVALARGEVLAARRRESLVILPLGLAARGLLVGLATPARPAAAGAPTGVGTVGVVVVVGGGGGGGGLLADAAHARAVEGVHPATARARDGARQARL